VVKNTLLEKAMEKTGKNYEGLNTCLKGTTAVMFCETANTPAKLIKEFRKTNEKPVLKGAYVEESVYIGDNMVDTLATIKSKNELIGDIIALLQSPAKNVVSALSSGGNKLAGIVKTLSEKPE
jgi:large subunit ribosomal protein L10